MKKMLHILKTDKVTYWGYRISFGCLLLTLCIGAVFFQLLPPLIPVYNSMPWGYARLANRMLFFLPLGIAIIFFISNALLSSVLYKKAALLSRLLSTTAIIISLIVLIFSIEIILLVH